ncbi:uncharacterized protein LOC127813230 [Diospyros lotus]|uniref:uncharacterized protein LOC127813230 n=1 Tax=Diospyros lotus TaxID=55363 RepID=UPI002258EADD|nr:uncharacterized protein LOC127813230 [Diospyros lotus]XP_052210056.1 uncharacterized protein LOC127813230 [Diospyros lotus]
MKFRKGSKVEVMSKKVVPFSWRCAEIVSGNKFTYSVKYDSYQGSSSEPIVERVSRKAIRPCPPTMEGIVNCEVGDVVEAFGNTSWKIATVSKVLDRDLYLVRLLGTPQEFKVHKSNTRVRQCWQDNTWFVIGKGSGMSEDVISYKLSTPNCYQKRDFQLLQANKKIKTQTGDDCFDVQGNAGLQETDTVSSRMQKRTSPYSSSLLEACAGNVKKIRGIQKEGRHPRSTPVPKREKVDAVAYPRENLGAKYMHASPNNRSIGYYKAERQKLNGLVGCSLKRRLEPNASDSDECSVGSCSVTSKGPDKFPTSHFVAVHPQVTDTFSSDAESFYGSGNQENCHFPPEEELAENIHRLELHAYRRTLEAFYASGPLSWEQEALLTNLRIMLHISNDEHLTELRNLISTGTGIHVS